MAGDEQNNLWHLTCGETVEAGPLEHRLDVDLVVVGGGYTGTSAALHAAEAGADVCLVEARSIGHGGSGRNVGLVNAGLWLPPDAIRHHLGDETGDRLIRYLAGAPDLVFDLIDRHQIACDAVRSGTLHCAHSAAGWRDLEMRHWQLSAAGAPVALLSGADTARRTGSSAFAGSMFDPRAGTIQPLSYVRGLARAAMAAGAHLFQDSPAQRISRERDRWVVETPGGTVRADALLLATNAYHVSLPDLVPQFVPVSYFQFATDPLPAELRATILPGGEGCWDTARVMSSFRLDSQGRLIIGAMGSLDRAGAGIHARWAHRKLAQLFPALSGQALRTGWSGRIAMTSDHLPKITDIGPKGLCVHGYSGRGIGPGTLFGRMAASALLGLPDASLPMSVTEPHAERAAASKSLVFEAGATLVHLLSQRGSGLIR